MTLEEAYKLYSEGKKIRRASWPNKKYSISKSIFTDQVPDQEPGYDIEDAIAHDWEELK